MTDEEKRQDALVAECDRIWDRIAEIIRERGRYEPQIEHDPTALRTYRVLGHELSALRQRSRRYRAVLRDEAWANADNDRPF